MNREIKFKVWDKDAKKWVKHLTYCIDDFSTTNKEWHIVLQYTGVKDKNGVEVYDGFITGRVGCANRVISHDGVKFQIHSINNPNQKFDLNQYSLIHDEVIGNIFENPELLNNQ